MSISFFDMSLANKLMTMGIFLSGFFVALFALYVVVHTVTTAYFTAQFRVLQKMGVLGEPNKEEGKKV